MKLKELKEYLAMFDNGEIEVFCANFITLQEEDSGDFKSVLQSEHAFGVLKAGSTSTFDSLGNKETSILLGINPVPVNLHLPKTGITELENEH